MKVVATSDTHGRAAWLAQAPPCDVLIHAGDMTSGGTLDETADFANELKQAQAAHILLVPGNHDACFQEHPGFAAGLFDARVEVLIDREVTIEGRTFYGSPWTPPFLNWWFMAEEERLARLYRKMPTLLDVLITHGPPFGVLDPGHETPHVGSLALAEALARRVVGKHVFGHLHGAGGQTMRVGWTECFNVAACDEGYTLVHPPAVFGV